MRMPFGILVLLVLVVLVYTLAGVTDDALGGWVQELLSVSLATAFALVFALYVYLKQALDEKERTRKHVRQYLKYLTDRIHPDPDPERVTYRRPGYNVLDQALSSGHVDDVFVGLVRLQDCVSRYQMFCDGALSQFGRSNSPVPLWVKQDVDRAAVIVREEAERCLRIMDGESDASPGGLAEEAGSITGRQSLALQADEDAQSSLPVHPPVLP